MSDAEHKSNSFNNPVWGSPSKGEVLLRVHDNSAAIDEEVFSNIAERPQWTRHTKLSLHTPDHGNLLALDVNYGGTNKKIPTGHFSPPHGAFTLYPELVDDTEDAKVLLLHAYKQRNEVIDTFHESTDSSQPRINYDHEAVRRLHQSHDTILRMEDLAEAEKIALIYNSQSETTPGQQIEIDEATSMAVCLLPGTFPNYHSTIEIPERKLAIMFFGAFYSIGGAKRRHSGPQALVVGQRGRAEKELVFEPIDELVSDTELNVLASLAKDIEDLKKRIPEFDPKTLGIKVLPKNETQLYPPSFPPTEYNQ